MFVGMLKENLVMKLFSLAASITMWFYVASDRYPNMMTSRTINAEIVKTGVAPTDVIVKVHTDNLPVEVTGPKSEVDALNEGDVKAEIDMKSIKPGQTQVKVTRYKIPVAAPNVETKGRMFVGLDVALRVNRTLPITPQLNTDAIEGRKYSTPRVTPEWASVSGAQDDVKRIAKLIVLIETSGQGVIADLPLRAVDKDGLDVSGIDISPSTSHVDLAVPEVPASRILPINVPNRVQLSPSYVLSEIVVDPPQITVVGKPEIVYQLTNVSTTQIVLDNLAGEQTREVALQLPQGVAVVGGRVTVRVTFKAKEIGRP